MTRTKTIRQVAAAAAMAAMLAGCTGSAVTYAPGMPGEIAPGYGTTNITNADYGRGLECATALSRMWTDAQAKGSTRDLAEITALGEAWMGNAIMLGARQGLNEAQVRADVRADGDDMSLGQAAYLWSGCRAGR